MFEDKDRTEKKLLGMCFFRLITDEFTTIADGARELCFYKVPLLLHTFVSSLVIMAWWLIGRFVVFRPKGRSFESCSSHHVETLSKFLAHKSLHYNCICTDEA